MAGGPVTDQPGARGARTFSGKPTIAPMRESRQPALEPGVVFAGRYEVIRKIGEVSLGVAYLVKDTTTNDQLVLKLIHPEVASGKDAIDRLIAEGVKARKVRHRNILAVFDVSQHDEQPYFTTEVVEGGTLRSWMVHRMRSASEISLETAVGLVRSILPGLAEAHRMGLVHRGLEPENVLLAGDPDAGNFDLKIADFGIAKAIEGSPDTAGPQADIYSVSAILYELLMEASPEARRELVSKSRADVPTSFDELLEKGLSGRPRSRHASVEEFAAALDAAMGGVTPGPLVPDPPPPPPPPPPPARPNAWASLPAGVRYGIIAFGAIVGLAVTGNLIGGDDPPPPPPVRYTEPQQYTEPQRYTEPAPPPQPTPRPQPVRPQPPPPPPQQAPTASGFWLDDNRNRYTVQHDGFNFVAAGFVPGTGNIQIRGTLTQAGAVFGVYSADTGLQFGFFGTGSVERDANNHVDVRYVFVDVNGLRYSGRWHVNHQ